MITDSRITDYINSLDPGDGELCDGIAREAVRSGVPIVRRETAALIKTMLALKKPERILEVGTAVGYSALLMARSMPETAHITTIEKYEKRIPIARENFKRAGMRERSWDPFPAPLILSSWMRPRASMSTGCRPP